MPTKSKIQWNKVTAILLAGMLVCAALFLFGSWGTATRHYVATRCADGVQPEVCVLINALRYDDENWRSNSYGVNNVRLHVGVWMANKGLEIYYNTGSGAHLLDGQMAPKLDGVDLQEFTKAMAQFVRDHELDERGKFRHFMLQPR